MDEEHAWAWAVLLCAVMGISFFLSALAADYHYPVSGEDQLASRFEARMNRLDARQDATLNQVSALAASVAAMQVTMTSMQKELDSARSDVSSIKTALPEQPKASH